MVRRITSDWLNRVIVCILTVSAVSVSFVQAQSVTLDIEGTLAASCSLGGMPSGEVALGDLKVAGSKVIPFTVDCNAPFGYALVSGSGAFSRVGGAASMAPGSKSFASAINYQVTTRFMTDAGSFGDNALPSSTLTATNAAPCVAATYLSSCPFTNSGVGAAAAGLPASLSIAWTPPSGPLQAGTYQDTLTLTVRART